MGEHHHWMSMSIETSTGGVRTTMGNSVAFAILDPALCKGTLIHMTGITCITAFADA